MSREGSGPPPARLVLRLLARLADVALVGVPTWLFVVPLLAGLLEAVIPAVVAGVVITAGYEAWLTSVTGQTVGKRAVGIRVVQVAEPGRPPGLAASGARAVVPLVLLFALPGFGWLLPYVWAFWSPDRRGLHDLAARTQVVELTG